MQSCMKLLMTLGIAAMLGGTTARASFFADFLSVSPAGSNFDYTYNLDFGSNNGAEELLSGDFVTIYDIVGFVSAIAGSPFSMSTQTIGITPPFQAPPDSGSLMNVTFTYTGPTVLVNDSFTGFTIVSTDSGTQGGFSSGQDTAVVDGMTKLGDTTGTPVPAALVSGAPEPMSLLLMGFGLLSVALLRRRRRPKLD